ncbi:MAG: TrkA C-terminal domain-containing protein, partial [Myxococcota bacterium]|nr:TrkA C-terminal domain-containing protein [Myxococcota bacterium]
TEFFVLDEHERLLGAMYFHELRRVLLEADHLRSVLVAGDLTERGRPTVTEEDDLDVAMQIFGTDEVEEIAVVDPADPRRLVGSVHKRDVLAAYSQEVMRRDLAGGVSSTVAVVDRVHQVDLGGGFVVQELLAPRPFLGRSLRALDLRSKSGVQVLLVRSPHAAGRAGIRVPGPEDRLEAGDRLVVAGPKEAVDRLAEL